MSSDAPSPNRRGRRARVKNSPPSGFGVSIEELKEEEMYDADVEILCPDEYEDADSDNEPSKRGSSSPSGAESDWQRDVLQGLNRLDCESGSSESSRPSSSGNKRKREDEVTFRNKRTREDEVTFFRKKHLTSRSPTPKVEIEEIASDEPATILKAAQPARKRPRSIRKSHTRLRNTPGASEREIETASRLSDYHTSRPRTGGGTDDDVDMDID